MTSTAERQETFLNECIDYFEEHISDEYKLDFYRECVAYLTIEEKLFSTDLFDLYNSTKSKTQKTLTKWVNDFVELLESEQQNLWESRSDKSLTKFPFIKRNLQKSGGAGNKTNYSIVPINIEIESTVEKVATFNNDSKVADSANHTAIKYYSRKLEKTPRYIKFFSQYLATSKSRKIFFILVLLVGVFSCIALFTASIGLIPLYPALGITFFCILIFNPIRYLINIALNKACLLSHLSSPISTVCISEIIAVTEVTKSEDLGRRLITRIVEGDCPICLNKHKLEKSVLLDNPGLFSKRIIGVCINNPREHRFSFDKDLMTGVKIIKG